tara:strand:- start:331 stop:2793 length:2463 start_codon:yes stop_codon:yes gene_type:complete
MSRAVPAHVVTSDSAIGGSVIERSLKFNRSDAPYLQATLGDGNEDKWTWSAWVKKTINEQHQNLFSSGSDSVYTHINFDNNDRIRFQNWHSAQKGTKITTRKIRDLTSWMHIVIIWDSGNSTADDRMRIYVNGTRETAFDDSTNPDQNQDSVINGNSLGGSTYGNGKHFVGKFADTSDNSGTYQTEINFVDGQAYDPSYFGFTDSQTGIWRPKKYEESYGSNGFRLDFSDNSAVTAITLGKDRSGQGNDFTPNNLSVSAGVGNDSVEDTPTNNFPTLNPLFLNATEAAGTFSEGNLKLVTTGSEYGTALSTFSIRYGKYYWEVKQLGGSYATHGIVRGTTPNADCFVGYDPSGKLFGFGYNQGGNIKGASGTGTTGNANLATSLATFTTNDIIGFASDISKGTLAIYKNNTLIYTITGINDDDWIPAISGYTSDGSYSINFGQQPFSYTPPTGYKTLSSRNLIPNSPSIIRPQKHFAADIYTGTGSTLNRTNLEFVSDLVWLKRRDGTNDWSLTDSVRGATKTLVQNTGQAESTITDYVTAFLSNGYQLGDDNAVNGSSMSYLAWCWKAGGSSTVTNNDGNNTSQVSANTTAGFSILTYTGNGTNNSNITMGHGLGKKPGWIIIKNRSRSADWVTWIEGIGGSADDNQKNLGMNVNAAAGQNSSQFRYADASIIAVRDTDSNGNNKVNRNGDNYVAYCWSEIPGFSKFGNYTGNGNNNGPFIYTGFRPAWVTIKCSSNTNNWQTWDSARESSNEMQRILEINDESTTEGASSNTAIDFLSDGFKIRTNFTRSNTSGYTYAYMAFAEQPGSTPFETHPNAR